MKGENIATSSCTSCTVYGWVCDWHLGQLLLLLTWDTNRSVLFFSQCRFSPATTAHLYITTCLATCSWVTSDYSLMSCPEPSRWTSCIPLVTGSIRTTLSYNSECLYKSASGAFYLPAKWHLLLKIFIYLSIYSFLGFFRLYCWS